MTLRPYQLDALDQFRKHYAAGTTKILYDAPTGSGKTTVFCTVVSAAVQKGKRVIVVVFGRKLVDQASKRLDREGVAHGVLMSGHKRYRPKEAVQVCSISTLYSRMLAPAADLIIIDEAHMAGSGAYRWLMGQYPNSFILAVTATPHLKAGLRHIADVVVNTATMKDLIAAGYLVPPVYYAPSKPDLSAVSIDAKTGDYRIGELSQSMRKANLYGDMVKSYREIGGGKPALLFCVDVEHSKEVVASFIRAGIPAEHVDAKSPEAYREAVIARLSNGTTKVVTNVGIMTTGVDIPCVEVIILARPTKSYNLFIQICGRGTRLHPGKSQFIILDHADCVSEHGFITTHRPCVLDGWASEKKGKKLELPPIYTCKQCYFIWDKEQGETCPGCGTQVEKRAERSKEANTSFEMKKIEVGDVINDDEVKTRIKELVFRAVRNGYKPGWVYHQLREDAKFGGLASKNFKYIEKVYAQMNRTAVDGLANFEKNLIEKMKLSGSKA